MADYQRMNEDGLETQASKTKEETVVVPKAATAANTLNQSKSVKLQSFKNPFSDKEKELDLLFQKYNDLGNPQIWLRDHPEYFQTCIAYNNGILYYDENTRKLIQLSSLDKDLTERENGWIYFDQNKIVMERSFDDILLDHNHKKNEKQEGDEEKSGNEDEEDEGGEEEAEQEAEEGENAEDGAEDGEQAEEGAEEGDNADEGAGEGVEEEDKGPETVTCLASFPELYLVALGSNYGNIYLLNSYDLKYYNSYITECDKVVQMVAGRTDIFSIHQFGQLTKSNFSNKEFNQFEKIDQGEQEEAWALRISPNKRWLAFCQKRVKKITKVEEGTITEIPYYQLVVLDQGEEKRKSDDDEDSQYEDSGYGSSDDYSSDYSGGEEEKKIKEVRYDMKLTEEDFIDKDKPFNYKDYESVKDLPSYQKLRSLFDFYPDSTKIVVRTEEKCVTSYLLCDKVSKITEVEKICEDKSKVVKVQVLSDNQTLVVMSYSVDQAEDLKIVDLEAASKKIRLGCCDAKDFCVSKDGKMIFVIDYDQKEGKTHLKAFETKTKSQLMELFVSSMAQLMNISDDSNYIHTFNRKTGDHAFLQLADYNFNLQDKAILDQESRFLMQLNKKTSQCELWDLKNEQLLGLYGKAIPYTVCGEFFYIVEDLSGSKVNISRVSSKTKEMELIQYFEEDHFDLQVTKDNKKLYCLNDTHLIYINIDEKSIQSVELWASAYPENYRCFQLSNDEKFIIAVSDKTVYKILTQNFAYDQDNYAEVHWWPRRLDAFHPQDGYMLSRYFTDTSIDKWDLKTMKSKNDYIDGHKKDRVEYCCFVSKGEKLVTINPKELIYWDVSGGKHAMLETIEISATPIYGHNKKLTGLQIDGKLYPWTEFLVWELSGNFAQLGFYKDKIEQKSKAMPFFKALLKNLDYIQGPYNRLFPYFIQQFNEYKEDDDPKKLAMVQHMLANVQSPQGFTFLSYLAYNNKQAFLREALKYEPKYLRDINQNFPLTIALKKQSVTTVNLLVEFVSKDQRLVEALNHDEICRLIEFSPTKLPMLINNSVSKIRGADPLGIDINEDLTDFYVTQNIVPAELHDKLCDMEAQPEDKKPVIYKRTSFLLNLVPGSEESVRFHEALAQCTDPEVYQSDVIKYILEYKWQQLKSKTYLPLIVSCFFLVALLIHVYTPGVFLPLYLLIFFLAFTVIDESRKVISGGIGYLSIPSALLIFLLPIYIFETMQAPGGYPDYILPIVNFAVWLNLINQLKSFANIRGFMIVLSESVISIKSFFAFFVLMIFMFTTSLIIQGKIRRRWDHFSKLKPEQLTYSQELYKDIPKENLGISDIFDEIWKNIYDVYLKMLGEFGLEGVFELGDDASFNYFDQIAFVVLTFIMCVTLLNLVVALMSSAYEEFKEVAVYQQQKELNSIILSVEIKMSYRRKIKQYEYLVWMEYQEDNQEKKSEIAQINEKMDENQANWKKFNELTKSQDDRIDKLANNLGVVQKEQVSMNSKLDELIKLIKAEKAQSAETQE